MEADSPVRKGAKAPRGSGHVGQASGKRTTGQNFWDGRFIKTQDHAYLPLTLVFQYDNYIIQIQGIRTEIQLRL